MCKIERLRTTSTFDVHFKGTGSKVKCEMTEYAGGPHLSIHTGGQIFEMTEADFEGFVSSMRHLFALDRKVQAAADNGARGAEPQPAAPASRNRAATAAMGIIMAGETGPLMVDT